MTEKEFDQITKKIGDAHRDPFTEDQFNVWYERFKDESFDVVNRACDLLFDEYHYFPMIVTLKEYIKRVQGIDKAKEESTESQKAKPLDPEYLKNMRRWARFFQWCAENKRFPKTEEETKKMKADFEKNHPNWRPRKRRESNQPEAIGNILPDSFLTKSK